jgi:transposase
MMCYTQGMKATNELRDRIEPMLPLLDERQRRVFLATEAISFGHGGVKAVSELSGVSRVTIIEGKKEVNRGEYDTLPIGRCRHAGAGRKTAAKKHQGLMHAIEAIVEPHTRGDPMSFLTWCSKSLRHIEAELKREGFDVSYTTIAKVLKSAGYSLQANRKDLAIGQGHPDRNAQFEYINEQTGLFIARNAPVLSIDAKKKENIGNFKNKGSEYHQKGGASKVLDHDFPIEELGKAAPYGIYDIFRNEGFVSVGISKDTSEFAVESIRKWWGVVGKRKYPKAKEMLLTADSGGSNGYKVRLWKAELQILANELNKKITVVHFPPGTSKWNKIEHRLFSFISKNWRGRPLVSLAVIVNLIGSTTTAKGLKVDCVIDDGVYERGIEVSDEEFDSIMIEPHTFHGEWNYTISPQRKRDRKQWK